jgi:hypothetical protein
MLIITVEYIYLIMKSNLEYHKIVLVLEQIYGEKFQSAFDGKQRSITNNIIL